MSEPVVVVAGGGDSASSDFAAGLATAAAAQASQDAQEAQAEAAAAVAIAGAAAGEAADANGRVSMAAVEAGVANDRVDELEAFVREGFGRISDALVATEIEHHLGETPDGGSAPEAHGDGTTPTPEPAKPLAKRTAPSKGRSGGAFGNSWWFKGRR